MMTRNKIHACPAESENEYPWLVYFHGEGYKEEIFYDVKGGDWERKMIPEMSNTQICTTAHGWLVMLELHPNTSTATTRSCFLLNPISMEKMMLPPLIHNIMDTTNYSCILTAPPSDPTCTVAFFEWMGPHTMSCRPGAKAWTEQAFDFRDEHPLPFRYTLLCGNKIYCLSFQVDDLTEVSFDEDEEEGRLRARPVLVVQGGENKVIGHPVDGPYLAGNFKWTTYYLVESQGDMYLVIVFHGRKKERLMDVWVFRMDFHGLKWERVSDLGDHRVFFLSMETSLSCSTAMVCDNNNDGNESRRRRRRVKENTIYIILPYQIGRTTLHVYDLEEKSITPHLVFPDIIPNISHGRWVMPMAN